ncbi:unnamed protein product [Urochloa humidicola]
MARLRLRITYLRDGDANTKLFHLQASHRMKKKHIARLEKGQEIAFTHEEKEKMLYQHFSSTLGSPAQRIATLDLAALGIQAANLELLDQPSFEEEVWETIKSPPNDKASGPDGFTAEFYMSAWPIIKEDVLATFNAFFRANRSQFHRVNRALITLLPKTPDPRGPGDYCRIQF